MRVNCHAHVFNLKAVLTEGSIHVLLNRIGADGWPPFIVEAVGKAMRKLLKDEYVDEDQLLRELIGQLSLSKQLRGLLEKGVKGMAVPIRIMVDGDLDGLAAGALRELLGKLIVSTQEDDDSGKQTVDDLVAFLAIGMLPTIEEVARALIRCTPEDAVCVTLMMDIPGGKGGDEAKFTKQMRDTSSAALIAPGRLLPFVAVNPLRKAHLQYLKTAVLDNGFVGVKLYPSLGYQVDTPAMDKVLEFCSQHDVPLLTHCSRYGFYSEEATRDFASPAAWRPVLKRYPGIRVCFGHFGGDKDLTEAVIPPGGWSRTILDLMAEHPGVYADISHHTLCMDGGAGERNYFANQSRILTDPATRGRVLFGSDFFLVRKRLRDDNLWRYFEAKFTAAEFKRITETNPRAYLGLPKADGTGEGQNIRRHLDFLCAHSMEVGALPCEWVTAALGRIKGESVRFLINRFGSRWAPKVHAHWYSDAFFRTQLRPDTARTLTFSDMGALPVRELKGWPGEHLTKATREQMFRSFASAMHRFLTQPAVGAAAEKGVTRTKAERSLAALFATGETQLFQFGEAVDRLYRFKDEEVAI